MRRPSPGSHSRLARGMRQFSKASVAGLEARGPDYRQAGRALFDDDRADRPLGIVDAGPLSEQQVDVGHIAVGDEGLLAVDDDVVAPGLEAGAHARGVGTGRGLGDDQRGQAAFGDARQEALLLFLVAEFDQGFDGMEIGGPDDAGGGAGRGDFAHTGQIAGIGQRRAAIGFGNEHGVQPQGVDVGHVVVGEGAAAVQFSGPGRDALARQLPHRVEQHGFFGAPGHGGVQALQYVH